MPNMELDFTFYEKGVYEKVCRERDEALAKCAALVESRNSLYEELDALKKEVRNAWAQKESLGAELAMVYAKQMTEPSLTAGQVRQLVADEIYEALSRIKLVY